MLCNIYTYMRVTNNLTTKYNNIKTNSRPTHNLLNKRTVTDSNINTRQATETLSVNRYLFSDLHNKLDERTQL